MAGIDSESGQLALLSKAQISERQKQKTTLIVAGICLAIEFVYPIQMLRTAVITAAVV